MERSTTSAADATPSFESYGGTAPENYERYFVPAIAEPLAHDLVRWAGLGPGERVVDLACGTGVVARLAAQRIGATGAVTGVDVNPGMLAVARTTPIAAANAEWREASAENLPFDDATQDAVLCQMGLQFFPDKIAALTDARRVLVAGGRLVLNVPGPTPAFFAVVEAALTRHLSPEVAKFVRVVFSLHDSSAVAQLLRDAGFESLEIDTATHVLHLPRPDVFLWQYVHSSPLAAAVANLDETQRSALAHDVVDEWRQVAGTDALTLELSITTAIARK
jgi:ubiquinone/menaquinone biosynthesis C-methylase UbiE